MEIRLLWNLVTIKNPAAASPRLPLFYKPSTVFLKPLYSERQELFCQHLYCISGGFLTVVPTYNLYHFKICLVLGIFYINGGGTHGRSVFILILCDFVAI
jgi:hypothetical protein